MPLLFVLGSMALVFAWAIFWHNSSLLIPTLSHGPRNQPRVALTFDDGPDPRITPLVLDILARQGVRATFFLVGDMARRHPELVHRIHHEGHLVANHSREHDWRMNFWRPRGVMRSIVRGERMLQRLVGYAPRFYRGPVGIKSPAHALVGWVLGVDFVGWTRTARDGGAFLLQPARLRHIAETSRPGDTILMHDGKWGVADDNPSIAMTRERYAAHLPAVIERLRARGLQPVRLDELYGLSESLDPARRRAWRGRGAGGWLDRGRKFLGNLRNEHATPCRLALATAIGVFVGSSPLLGLHAQLGLACAVKLRLNKLAVFLGTNISNPLTGPFVIFLNIQTGCRLLTGRWLAISPEHYRGISPLSVGNTILVYWAVGFPLAGFLLAMATALVSYPVFRKLKSRNTNRI